MSAQAKKGGDAVTKLYSSWFCPFAQRAWIAVEEKGIPYEYVEVDPYAKPPDLMAVNPRGLVPALEHQGKAVYESMVVMEYIDEAFSDAPSARSLMPSDPFDRAIARIWMDFTNRRVVPTFYRYLQKQEGEEQEAARSELIGYYKQISAAMSDIHPEGPFFLGPRFSLADIALAPWPIRHFVLEHYRGFQLPDEPELARFRGWLAAVLARPSVKATLQDEGRMLAIYKRYADNSAQSEVAQAINANRPLP
eukprot:jgi/Mesen1/598/ME001074S10750